MYDKQARMHAHKRPPAFRTHRAVRHVGPPAGAGRRPGPYDLCGIASGRCGSNESGSKDCVVQLVARPICDPLIPTSPAPLRCGQRLRSRTEVS
jgi:hypothetical protein